MNGSADSRPAKSVASESAGTRRDFQAGAISYLYGTRFFGYLGLVREILGQITAYLRAQRAPLEAAWDLEREEDPSVITYR